MWQTWPWERAGEGVTTLRKHRAPDAAGTSQKEEQPGEGCEVCLGPKQAEAPGENDICVDTSSMCTMR